ncbi:type II secretion system protein GspL [uncultured Roseobacter sp.]|uniref:type II secretion system protein GspL n=1 Tax=uncultured Roseobacter sp. TaxID=114847 RepID=UPI00260BA076|nr:type II secretion system protein GspL [uncultured Roseobacter sp.]
MVTQCGDGCAITGRNHEGLPSRALVPVLPGRGIPGVSDALAARLNDAAREANRPAPIVLPTGAVSLFNVLLPLKSPRQRRKAMAFALSGQLCEQAGGAELTLGPSFEGDHYLVACCDDDALARAIPNAELPGAALPDVLGIPRPETDGHAWNLWCEASVVYVRATDATGFVCRADDFTTFWKVGGQPELFSLTGPLDSGPDVTDLSSNPPPADPNDLQMDLRRGAFKHRKRAPRRFVRFSAIALIICAIGQLTLLAVEARALAAIAEKRTAIVTADLAERVPDASIGQPLFQIAARISEQIAPQRQDRFMTLLAQVSRALDAQDAQVTFRELRYGAQEDVLTLLVQGREFSSLQASEVALSDAGMEVTSGTATATESGAEILLQVRDAS